MKRICLCFLFFVSLFPFSFFLLPSLAARSAVSDSRLAVFDDVWETVRERYYDPAFHGLDWETERERFRPLAESAQTTAELYSVIRSMLSDLKDAHTRVFAPDERFDWQHPRFISVGISVREVEGLPVVLSVEQGSDAWRAGVRAGDRITKIDGESALNLFARRLKEQSGSSTPAAARFVAMSKLFDGRSDTALDISWIGFGGLERTATLKREWRERNTGVRVRREGKVGIVELDVFTQASAVDFMRALTNRLRGVRGLVVDLRNNGGGEADAMAEVASAFLPQGVSLGRFTDRSRSIQFEPHTRSNMLYAAETIESFHAPVVILTSERTSSAAEIFVAAMTDARRAFTIGETTCGCVLAIRRRHILPDGGELDVSEMDYFTAEGKRLEGEGIIPDISVTLERQDIRAHRDRAMESAIERLKKAHR